MAACPYWASFFSYLRMRASTSPESAAIRDSASPSCALPSAKHFSEASLLTIWAALSSLSSASLFRRSISESRCATSAISSSFVIPEYVSFMRE